MTMLTQTYIDLSDKEQRTQLRKYMKTNGVDIAEEPTEVLTEDINEIIDGVDHIWKKEQDLKALEEVINSLISLLFVVPVKEVTPLAKKLCAKLEEGAQVEGKADVSFKVFEVMFTGYPKDNTLLYDIYCSWIKVAALSNNCKHLPCDLNQMAELTRLWERPASDTHHLYRLMYETQYTCGEHNKATDVMVALLQLFDEETAHEAKDDAVKCIQRSISSVDTFSVDHLLQLAPIQALQGELIYDLLNIFVSGNIRDYQKFSEENPNFMEENGLDDEQNQHKMRLLTLIDVIGSQRELSYETLMEGVGIQEDQIEELVIHARQTKIIRARIDQVNRKVIVSQACQRTFGDDDWKKLQANYTMWKDQLKMVVEQLYNL